MKEYSPGEAVRLMTSRGREYAVFVRRTRGQKPVVRKLYFGLGAPITVHDDDLHLITEVKVQDAADAIAILLAHEKR